MAKNFWVGALALLSLVIAPLSGASAADLRMPMKAPPVAAPAPVATWTGCYIGVEGGGVSSRTRNAWDPNPAGFPQSGPVVASLGTNTISDTGGTVGAEIGCNYQFGGVFVVGAEGDWSWTGINSTLLTNFAGCAACGVGGTALGAAAVTETVRSNWLATLRGRLGFLATPSFLIYATGGLAIADLQLSDAIAFAGSGTFNAATSNNTQTGWTAGGGLEWMFLPNWSLKGEYLHVDLGNVTYTSANSSAAFPLSTISHSHKFTEDIGRAGINWHF